jgi:hypothetical protein
MTVHARSNKLLITGRGHNVVKQFPMFGKGDALYWWAENGIIHWEDSRPRGKRPDGQYGTLAWDEAARRVLNLSQMIYNSSEEGHYADEKRRMQQFVCDMEKVIQQAREQGTPDDPDAVKEAQRRRATSVLSPGKISNVVAGRGDVDRLAVGQQRMVDPFDL